MRASGFLAPTSVHDFYRKLSETSADWGLRDALRLIQQASGRSCEQEACHKDEGTILTILFVLIISIVLIFTAFFFFREDKEEQVTPLCPQLVVRDASLTFKIALDPAAEKLEVFSDKDGAQPLAKVAMDWPDPFRPCASGIASTARLQSASGMNLATVVARNVAVSGQALALCRSGCEIFGFVESDSENGRYHVRHRTGVHLLTLTGNFSTWDVEGVNPAGAPVFSAKKEGDFCVGKVSQHVDAGLLICCIIAAHIHRVLQQPPHGIQTPPLAGSGTFPLGQQTDKQKKDTDLDQLLGNSSSNAGSPAGSLRAAPASPQSLLGSPGQDSRGG